MIYLLETFTGILGDVPEKSVPVHAMKIGYSDDNRGNGRFKDYTNAGLVIRVLKTIPGGSVKLEHYIQKEFSKYRVEGRSIEWFYFRPEILDFFNSCETEEDILRSLGITYDDLFVRKPVTGFVEFFNKFGEVSEEDLEVFLPILVRLDEISTFECKLRYICEEVVVNMKKEQSEKFIGILPILYQTLLLNLSLDELKSLSYRKNVVITRFETSIHNSIVEEVVANKVLDTFVVGRRYPMIDIKSTLGDIYREYDMKKTPKATDLSEFFDIKTCNIFDEMSNKYGKGFEILSIKQ